MNFNKTIPIFFALLLALSIYLFLRENSSADLPTTSATVFNGPRSEIARNSAASTPPPVNDVAQTVPKQGAAFDWRAMDKRYQTATNLRAFFYEALQKPTEGGYYYAAQVRSLCRRNILIAAKTLPLTQRQAVDDLSRRCDFSLSELDDADRQLAAKRDLNFGDDPIIAQIVSTLMAKDDSARAGLLNAAIAGGNPDVIGSLLSSTGETLAATVTKDSKMTSEYATDIVLLVQCQMGADCASPESMRTRNLCAVHGWCADNVRDALRNGLGSEFERVDQLAKQLTNDMRKPGFTPSPPLH